MNLNPNRQKKINWSWNLEWIPYAIYIFNGMQKFTLAAEDESRIARGEKPRTRWTMECKRWNIYTESVSLKQYRKCMRQQVWKSNSWPNNLQKKNAFRRIFGIVIIAWVRKLFERCTIQYFPLVGNQMIA